MGKRAATALLGLGLLGLGAYRFRRDLFAGLLRLPPARYIVTITRDLPVPLPDGATLLADHYAPRAAGRFPTILVRTPYGRASELGLFGAGQRLLASTIAERGYHMVFQGVRGRFRSDGHFEPFVNEAADGRATMEWISRQPWFDGNLGMWGPSYLGYTQWAVAADSPPYLKALVPMFTSTRFSRLWRPDGAFALDTALRWTYLLLGMEGRHKQFTLAGAARTFAARLPGQLQPALNHLPVGEADTIAIGRPVSCYQAWVRYANLNHPYWQRVDQRAAIGNVTAQIHLIAGWYDIFLREQLADYAALAAAGRAPYLTVGPQHHLEWSVVWDGIREGLAWFDAHLKGEREQLRRRPVRIYVMGADEWHEMDYWPPPAKMTRYYLHAGGLLSTRAAAEQSAPDRYRYDPCDPTPVAGGPLFNLGGGPRDQRAIEARRDVLVYTSPPLDADTDVIGHVRLELFVHSSLAHADFVGRLCDVDPGGQSINICDGLLRVAPGTGDLQPDGSLRIEIDMWATARRFARGHRIRLQVCSGGHPRWARNLGAGDPIDSATRVQAGDQTIYHDAGHPSALVLPIGNRWQ